MIERRQFGRTGHASSRVIFGAAALAGMNQAKADELLAILLEFGVNHLDTAASYGESELRLAPWLAAHRAAFFVATKTGDRSGDGARASLERSLTRLGVDQVDLVQLHNLVEPDEWEVAHGTGGAVAALVRARAEGLVRYIGVTGHGTRIAGMHRRSLERFDFDSVLVPYNFLLWRDPGYRSDLELLLALCADRGVAVQTIKSVARRRWPEGSDASEPHFAWYQPLVDHEAVGRAVAYVLAQPGLFLNTSSDARLLRMTLEAAAVSGPAPSDAAMQADVDAFEMEPLFDGVGLERI